jgi:hypothetical protein
MEENENGNWRKEIKRLNFEYLYMVKRMGAMPEHRGYAQTVFGLDNRTLKSLTSINPKELHKMADVGGLLFRLKLADLKIIQNLNQKGNGDRATSLLAAALAADCSTEGES